MSIKVLAQVWEHSDQSGGALLVLLAIADFADDAGRAWPSVKTLAKKARLSTRQTQSVIRDMENAGELRVESSTGPHGTNTYNVRVGVKPTTGGAVLAPLQSVTGGGAVCDMGGVKPTSSKPPLGTTIIEPPLSPAPAFLVNLREIPAWPQKAFMEEAKLRTWIEGKGLQPDHLEKTSLALVSKWDGRKYKSPIHTFKNWCLRPPLLGPNGSQPSQSKAKKQDYSVEKYQRENAWLHNREEKR